MLTHPSLALLQQQHFPATGSPLSPNHQGQDLFQSALPTAAAPNQRVSLWRKHSLNASHATRTVAPNISSLLPRRNTGKILTASLSPMGAVHMLIQWIIPSWKMKYLKQRKGTRSSDVHSFQASLQSSQAHYHLPSRINTKSVFKRIMNNCTTKPTGTSKFSKNRSELSCWNAKVSNCKKKSTTVPWSNVWFNW